MARPGICSHGYVWWGAQKLRSLAEEGSRVLKYGEAAEVTAYGMTQEAVSGLLPNFPV